jgi:transcriptional regulator with XRE-family HTH domain
MSNFSKWLNSQMNATKTRQIHLAERVGVSATAVSKWRDGLNTPDVVSLVKLAEIFRVDAVWLMQLAGIPLSDNTNVPANSLFLAEFSRLSVEDKKEIETLVHLKAQRDRGKSRKK